MSPGGLRGLQLRWGALIVPSVGSTPMRSRQFQKYKQFFNEFVSLTEVIAGYGLATAANVIRMGRDRDRTINTIIIAHKNFIIILPLQVLPQ